MGYLNVIHGAVGSANIPYPFTPNKLQYATIPQVTCVGNPLAQVQDVEY
jgi:hypothetical protein